MALETVFLIPFPLLTPLPTTTTPKTTTQIRFSRWNNNPNPETTHRQTQHQLELQLRRHRRLDSALIIANLPPSSSPSSTPIFKSTGTPSTPSSPSIPGKKSKYSKPKPKPKPSPNHPAFLVHPKRTPLPDPHEPTEVRLGDVGLSYVVPGAPFEFMYSYTETPKVRPVGLREPPVAPFGPSTLPRPWTGRKPLPPSKKKLPEFDSFTPPPPGKKGVKSVQKPGPFLPGAGPRYVMSREEVLGEALTADEVKEMVEGCRKTKRQLNMGRDGLTHNMLDNIHAHWKRRRVCKIKCKGVCTVDMDNVCQQLEEKTGGKIIYHRGGIVYLFRGRNYNYKTRPRFPLMLWKPVTPVYPRLIRRVPEGLTLEEATAMRKRGHELPPICKLGKNGVYVSLVKNVREAFEACELVRVDCQGLNPSDYRKIGAKLQDLVPCVLTSFENEHILMWRGREWKSSLLPSEDVGLDGKSSETVNTACPSSSQSLVSEDEEESVSLSNISIQETRYGIPDLSLDLTDDSDVDENEETSFGKDAIPSEVCVQSASNRESQTILNFDSSDDDDDIQSTALTCDEETGTVEDLSDEGESISASMQPGSLIGAADIDNLKPQLGDCSEDSVTDMALQDRTGNSQESISSSGSTCTEGVLFLWRQAVEDGSAIILDPSSLDADVVYERSVAFSQVSPPGPVFRHHPRKIAIQKSVNQETGDVEVAVIVPEKKSNEKKLKERKSSKSQKPRSFNDEYLNVVPQGSLKVDELAKLLA